jgi:hypothetical protein
MIDRYYTKHCEDVAECKSKKWELHRWTKRPALINKNQTKIYLYTGQKYNPKYYKLDPQGWDHDHCIFCFECISDCEHEECCNEGYTNPEGHWICIDCFEHLIINGEDPKVFLKTKCDNTPHE